MFLIPKRPSGRWAHGAHIQTRVRQYSCLAMTTTTQSNYSLTHSLTDHYYTFTAQQYNATIMTFRLQDKVVVLTGASSGIGASIAEHLYKDGARVMMGARRGAKLAAVQQAAQAKYNNNNSSSSSSSSGGGGGGGGSKNPGMLAYQECNVIHPESVAALVAAAKEQFQVAAIDVLINCAGVMYFTEMKNALIDQWQETVNVNCQGVLNGLAAVLPDMVAAGKNGKILTISSDAGMRQFPNLAVYCASKAFVETLCEITRRELVGTGVTLTTICPGDVKGTELILKNTDQSAADKMGVEIGKPVGTGFSRNQLLDTDDVADAVMYALTAPSHVAINTVLIEPRDQT